MALKECIACGDTFRGRKDKKFCSVKCKNQYHYKEKNRDDVVGLIDRILHKNRAILKLLFADETEGKVKLKLPRIVLTKLGFNFDYYTGTYLNTQKKRYYYIYDYAWMEFSLQEILLVRKKLKK